MNNLIKFSMEDYNSGNYEVVNQLGEAIKIIAIEFSIKQPIIGIHNGEVETWFLDGSFMFGKECAMDIYLKPIEENELVK